MNHFYALAPLLRQQDSERKRLPCSYPKKPHFRRYLDKVILFKILVMQKTKKSIAKRFKITGSGKVMRRTPGHRHCLRNRTSKQKRAASKDKPTSHAVEQMVHKAVPFA